MKNFMIRQTYKCLPVKSPMRQIPMLFPLYGGACAPLRSHPLPSYTLPSPPTKKLQKKRKNCAKNLKKKEILKLLKS